MFYEALIQNIYAKNEEILLNSPVFLRINLGIYVVTLIRSYLSRQEIQIQELLYYPARVN